MAQEIEMKYIVAWDLPQKLVRKYWQYESIRQAQLGKKEASFEKLHNGFRTRAMELLSAKRKNQWFPFQSPILAVNLIEANVREEIQRATKEKVHYSAYKYRVRTVDGKIVEFTCKANRNSGGAGIKVADEIITPLSLRHGEWMFGLLPAGQKPIEKTRFTLPGPDWTTLHIDRYTKMNHGLITLDAELLDPQQSADLTKWTLLNGLKIAPIPRGKAGEHYSTEWLQKHPFTGWSDLEISEHEEFLKTSELIVA